MLEHPVVVVRVRAQCVDLPAAENPNEEVVSLLEVRNRETDVVGTNQPWQSHAVLLLEVDPIPSIKAERLANYEVILAIVDPIRVA
jgi:hypothetical protein